jgi:excisionase family DNA binding protein
VKYLSTAEAAKVIGISSSHMSRLLNDGLIRYSNIGTGSRAKLRILEDDVREFMDQRAGRPGSDVA